MHTVLAFVMVVFPLSCARELHVDPILGGSNGDGSSHRPWAHVTDAQEAARDTIEMDADVSIVLHRGVHPPFSIGPQHSGKRPNQVRYVGRDGAIISGGVEVPQHAFVPDASRPNVYTANLTALGFRNLGDLSAGGCVDSCANDKAELFWGTSRMVLARYPNIDAQGQWSFVHCSSGGPAACVIDKLKDKALAERVLSWDVPNAWVHGYWTWDWADCHRSITSVNTNSTSVVITLGGGTDTVGKNARFYGVNLLSELDVPGEYYIDRTNGILYFYPPLPPSKWTVQRAVLSVAQTALDISNASGITLENLEVAHTRGTAVVGMGVSDVLLHNCTVWGSGQSGVILHGVGSGLRQSIVHSTGCSAVEVHGGDVDSLQPGNMFVDECTIHTHGLWKRTYQPAIHWAGVRNNYTRNHVFNGPHSCILGGGNEGVGVECLFEYNTINDCAFEAADAGAFYTCGQQASAWVNRGNILRHSTMLNIRNTAGTGVQGPAVQAIYLDDQMSGWSVYNNTIYNSQVGILLGGGRRNLIYGNYFQACDLGIHFDNRGMNWEQSSCNCTAGPEGCKPDDGHTCNPGGVRYMLVGPGGKEYAAKWPELLSVETDRPCVPVHNIIRSNEYCNCSKFCDQTSTTVSAWGSTLENTTKVTCQI